MCQGRDAKKGFFWSEPCREAAFHTELVWDDEMLEMSVSGF